jgi:hypothetical protein
MGRWIRIVLLLSMTVPANRAGLGGATSAAGDEPPLPKSMVPAGVAKSARSQRASLDVTAAGVRPAVFAIGGRLGRSVGEQVFVPAGSKDDDGRSILGTGVLISRKHRLVATAAHVADSAIKYDGLVAVADGTASSYRVDGVWYHPGVVRWLDVGLPAQSMDPRDGDVALPTFDVAIVRLAEGGPPLPRECMLANDDEMRRLDHGLVGHLGFPSKEDASWPTDSRNARAKLVTGVITCQVAYTDGNEDHSAGPGQRRWVRSTASLGRGASGGPLFLENGHVIALYFGASATADGIAFEEFVRVDALRDILVFHRLGDHAPAENGLRSAVGKKTSDQKLEKLRRAVKLVRSAEQLRAGGQYFEAGGCCNEAIKLVPEYGWALLRRAEVYLYFCQAFWQRLSPEQRRDYCAYALDDTLACANVLPRQCLIHRANLLQGYARLYVGVAFVRREAIQRNVVWLDGLVERPPEPLDDEEKAELLDLRAFCRERLGDLDGARADFDAAIRLSEYEPRWYLDRADFWTRRNRAEPADRDRTTARRLMRGPEPP